MRLDAAEPGIELRKMRLQTAALGSQSAHKALRRVRPIREVLEGEGEGKGEVLRGRAGREVRE